MRFRNALPTRLPSLPREKLHKTLRSGGWVTIGQLATVLIDGTDLLIIGRFLGAAAVVPYVCTNRLTTVLDNNPKLLMETAGAALAELKVTESRQRLFEVTTAAIVGMMLASGAVCCIVLAVNKGFVGWWVGANQFGGAALTMVLLLEMMLRHWNLAAIYSLFSFGRERRNTIVNLLDGLVTALSSLILVPALGAIGAPLASILGACAVSLPGNLVALTQETAGSVSSIAVPLWEWFWRFCIVAVAAVSIDRLLAPVGFLGVSAAAAAVAAIYLFAMLPVILRPPIGIYVMPRIVPIVPKVWAAWLSSAYE